MFVPRYPIVLILLMAAASSLFAADPILDLRVKDGVQDTSKLARPLLLQGDSKSAAAQFVRFTRANAITIAYSKEDPLFGRGACTYIFRCRVGQLFHNTPYSIAGRWDYAQNKRVISLTISGDQSCPRFQISADGRAEGGVGAVQQSPLSSHEWVNLVGRFEPSASLSCRTYDDAPGGLRAERAVKDNVLPGLNELAAAFVIGAPADVEMDFSRLRVWNTALSNAEIKAALAER